MEYIENRTFEEIAVGETASLIRVLTKDDILLFAAVSGDVNPAHVDEEFARSDMFQKIIAHGMWGAALISTVLGTTLPGPGTIYLGQTLRFRRPVAVGDEITVEMPAEHTDELIPEDIPIDILFRDEHVVVVNKPAGMVVYPAAD